ncbi:MAG: serine/threonine-protein kinase [Gemmataceae bacterium]
MSEPPSRNGDQEDIPLLEMRLLREYSETLQQGKVPQRDRFYSQAPHLASHLSALFDQLDLLHRSAGHLQELMGPAGGTSFPHGRLLGSYQILSEIGRGGMGIVYEAEDLQLRRRVAVKVLPATAALDPNRLRRFQREAQTAAALQHLNLVPVYHVGQEDGIYYFVMQRIEGLSLADHLGRWRKETPEIIQDRTYLYSAVRWVIEAAAALSYIHEEGYLHRDVKPSNLLLTREGHIRVSDFGLARALRSDNGSHSATLAGTLRYMSPEQLRGEQSIVDERSDVYALAATLYELVTLHPPFQGPDDVELIQTILDRDPDSPRQRNPAITPDLDAVIMRGLAKLPQERYANPAAFATDLQRWCDHLPTTARPVTSWGRLVRWCRRKKRRLIHMVLVGATGLFVGLMVSLGLIWKAYENEYWAHSQEASARQVVELQQKQLLKVIEVQSQLADKYLASVPGEQKLQRRLLKQASEVLEDLARAEHGSLEVKREAARAFWRLSAIEHRLNGPGLEARQAVGRAVQYMRKVVEQERDPATVLDFGYMLRWYAINLNEQGAPFAEYSALFAEAAKVIADLLETNPNQPSYLNLYHDILTDRARLETQQQRIENAITINQQAIQVAENLARQFSKGHPLSFIRLASDWKDRSELLSTQGWVEQAIEAMREAVKNDERLKSPEVTLKLGDRDTTLCCRLQLANLLMDVGNLDEVPALLKEFEKTTLTLIDQFSPVPHRLEGRFRSLKAQADLSLLQGDRNTAKHRIAEMCAHFQSMAQPRASFRLFVAGALCLYPSDLIENPGQLLAMAQSIRTDHPEEKDLDRVLGMAYLRNGHFSEARSRLLRVVDTRDRYLTGHALYLLALSYALQGNTLSAQQYLKEADSWRDSRCPHCYEQRLLREQVVTTLSQKK